ncbi:hypothetical protein Leryth_026994 [Lithospermum erythrorhizon]|nr:hypothetical protein Leryth_026994 [Lithospermum erythrorhizon]
MDADERRARRRAYYAGMYNGVICPCSYALLILVLFYSCPRPDAFPLLPLILKANKVEINRKSRESSRLNPNRDAIIKRSRDSYAAKQSASRESNSALDGHRPSCEVPSPNVHGPDVGFHMQVLLHSMTNVPHAKFPLQMFMVSMVGCINHLHLVYPYPCHLRAMVWMRSPPYAPSHNAPSSAFLPIPTKQVSHTSGGLYERVSMSRNKRTQLSQLHDKRLLVLPKVPPCKILRGCIKVLRRKPHYFSLFLRWPCSASIALSERLASLTGILMI